MPTENNWMCSNLSERFDDRSVDFRVLFSPKPIKTLSFEQAAKDSATKIVNGYNKLFLAFSGGIDSTFILLLLHEMKVDVTPIIVNFQANQKEYDLAIAFCKKLNITPVIITLTEKDFFLEYLRKIYIPINGIGINGTPLVLAKEYAIQNKGTLISGEHMIDDDPFIIKASMAEWDFYNDTLIPNHDSVGILVYTPEIMLAIVEKINGQPTQKFKNKLYGMHGYIDKYKPAYSNEITNTYNRLLVKKPRPLPIKVIDYRDNVLKMLKSWC